MHSPDVVGVALQGREARVLGLLVAPGLLETERLHAEHEALVRVVRIEGETGAADAVAQVRRVAEEEVELVTDEQGQQIGGPARSSASSRREAPCQSPPTHASIAARWAASRWFRASACRWAPSSVAPGRSGASVDVSDMYAASTWPMANSGSSSASDVIWSTRSTW